jgi:hypothetical protein
MSAPIPTPADLAGLLWHLERLRARAASIRARPSFLAHLGILGIDLLEDLEYHVNEALDPGSFLRNHPALAEKFAADTAVLLARLAAEKAGA